MSKITALTAPNDKKKENKWRPDKTEKLTNHQTEEAMKDLNIDNFI